MTSDDGKFIIAQTPRFSIRFNQNQMERLKRLADQEELSIAGVIRLAVKRFEESSAKGNK